MAFSRRFNLAALLFGALLSVFPGKAFGASLQFDVVESGTPPEGSLTNAITVGSFVAITMQTDFPLGYIFYTVDGSQPSFSSTPYDGRMLYFGTNATIRAAAYSSNLTQNVRAELSITVIPVFDLWVNPPLQGLVSVEPNHHTPGNSVNHYGSYLSNSVVTLKAFDREGLTFERWEGDATGTNHEIQVVMKSDKNIYPRFLIRPVISIPAGGGTVEAFPEAVRYGDGAVQLTAIPDPSHFFVTWSGGFAGSLNPVKLPWARSPPYSPCSNPTRSASPRL
jgi:hypothetical protein